MLGSFIESQLICTNCGKFNLRFSDEETSKFYDIPGVITIDTLDSILDGVFGDIMIMECTGCGSTVRGTFKEFEFRARKRFTETLKYSIIKELVEVPKSVIPSKRTLIYCAKCSGFDGKGSCTLKIFSECDLKRMPLL